jgi:hypothetical protein
MKAYWGSGGIAPRILWPRHYMGVVSFTPGPLYPQRKSPGYPLDRRLGGPQSDSGRGGEEENFQPLPGLEPPTQPMGLHLTHVNPGCFQRWRYDGLRKWHHCNNIITRRKRRRVPNMLPKLGTQVVHMYRDSTRLWWKQNGVWEMWFQYWISHSKRPSYKPLFQYRIFSQQLSLHLCTSIYLPPNRWLRPLSLIFYVLLWVTN